MRISKEYKADQGIVVITVENPPLATTRHTIVASALADGSVVLQSEIDKLTAKANADLANHIAVLELING